METLRVGLIIPAYNEEGSIKRVVDGVLPYGQPIVIDDASTDGTGSIALKSGAIVVRNNINLGYEGALESGFKVASDMGIDIIITLDADGQHNPKLVGRFIESIRSGNDLVVGVRDKLPRISEKIFALYSRHKFGIKDPLCGMKAYKTDLYQKIGYFDSHKLVGSELAFRSILNGCKLGQVSFIVESRKGKSKYGGVLLANVKILKAMFITFITFI
jgi:glycosyltransferase involved in cell wall biosynthesis